MKREIKYLLEQWILAKNHQAKQTPLAQSQPIALHKANMAEYQRQFVSVGAPHPSDDASYLHDETILDDSSISNYRMRDYEAVMSRHRQKAPKSSSNNHSVLTNYNPLTALETSDNLSNTHLFEQEHVTSSHRHQRHAPFQTALAMSEVPPFKHHGV